MKAFRLSREGPSVLLEIDRPPANVLDLESLSEITSAVRGLNSPDLRTLVLSGRPHFCAGVDIADHAPAKASEMLAAIHGLLSALLDAPFPTVAAVRGACLGGGAEVALSCDVVFAARDARIGFPEISLACFPPAAVLLLPELVGSSRAVELILSGETISGSRAAEFGFAARSMPERDLDAAASAFVRGLAARSRGAVGAACRLMREPKRRAFHEGRARAEEEYRGLAGGPDLGRAVDEFLKRRQARRMPS